MPIPDFTSPVLFPSFSALPLTTTTTTNPQDDSQPATDPVPDPVPDPERDWYLLAQISQNMTLTKPTLICADASSQTFALVFDTPHDTLDLAAMGLKRGCTAVVRCARRTPPDEEGKKQGFVRIEKGREAAVRVVPGPLERVVAVGRRLRGEQAGEEQAEEEKEDRGCESCGKREGRDGGALMRCTGCGEARYCGKECQVKGWNEGGHKADCKIIKGIRAIWP
ncbi:hypothetical protein MFIFM68171_05324 [Madurella fahalii]|uniref:MYND-type domain-containing protein n=1 Tax=Madurella fahalii TaxID=1157608 RepID=A0ABQ0GBH3_9PEZI